MVQRTKITLIVLCLVASEAIAQKPPVSPERSRLQFLVGSFSTDTRMPAGPGAPKGATGTGTSVIRWALDSMFVLIDEESLNSIFGQYRGHGVLGFEDPTKQYVLNMYNNFGDHISYTGGFIADSLVLQTRVPMPGHPFDQKLVWYKVGDAVKLKVLNDDGDGYRLVIEQTAVSDRRGLK